MRLVVKKPLPMQAMLRDADLIPGSEDPFGGGHKLPSRALCRRIHGQKSLVATVHESGGVSYQD